MENKTIFSNLNSFSDIVQAMVDGVKKEWVNVDMRSFGHTKTHRILGINVGEKCYGCAATNTLCELMQESFTKDQIRCIKTRVIKVNYGISTKDLKYFESAIDLLRNGNISCCLNTLELISKLFSFELPEYEDVELMYYKYLPELTNDGYKSNLHYYQEFADKLRENNL
jgi:hypothetical protein